MVVYGSVWGEIGSRLRLQCLLREWSPRIEYIRGSFRVRNSGGVYSCQARSSERGNDGVVVWDSWAFAYMGECVCVYGRPVLKWRERDSRE